MHKISRILSIALIALMLVSSVAVSATENNEFATIGFQVSTNQISAGQAFPVNITLDFDEVTAAEGGIMVWSCDVKFDTDFLQILDPNTMEPVAIEDNGELAEGSSYYIFGNLGIESSLSVNLNEDANILRIVYGSRSEGNEISVPGPVLRLAFKAHNDLEVIGSVSTHLEIARPEAVASKVITSEDGTSTSYTYKEIETDGQVLGVQIIPPFVIPSFGSHIQGSTLNISGRSYIDQELGEPLVATITNSGGDVVAEQEATFKGSRYNFSFELNEDTFPVDRYKLTLTYLSSTASREFDIVEKSAVIIPDPVVPEDPVDPIEPDDGENEIPDGNTGSDNSGNTGSDNTGSGNTGSDSTDKPTKPDKTDKNGIDFEGGIVTGIKNDNTTPKPGATEKEEPKVERPKAESYPTDIAEHWAKSNIEYVYDYKLMNGYSDGTFGADNSITRAEFATVMSRFLELDENPSAAGFDDTANHWAKGYIGALAAKGIVGGVSDTEFEPDSNITREQIAVILNRAFSLKAATETGTFTDDASISDWAYDGVYNVLSAGYMKGDTAGNFNPLSNATRAEVATIIFRLHSAK